jgi:DNA modification methylase
VSERTVKIAGRIITIDSEIEAKLPKLNQQRKENLRKKIDEEGFTETLTVWLDGDKQILLDGHNRLSIIEGKKITPRFRELKFKSKAHAIRWIYQNASSQHEFKAHNYFFWAEDIWESVQEDLKKHRGSGKTTPEMILEEFGHPSGVSVSNLNDFHRRFKSFSNHELDQFSQGELSFHQINKDAQKREDAKAWAGYLTTITKDNPETIPKHYNEPKFHKMKFQDVIEKGLIPECTVDCVICDPPYGVYYDENGVRREWAPQYKDLGAFCLHVLKEGASAFILTGHYDLHRILNYLLHKDNKGLEWRWMLPWVMFDSGRMMKNAYNTVRKIQKVEWKPIICLSKGSPKTMIPVDVVKSTLVWSGEKPKQKIYEWKQSMYGFMRMIELYTKGAKGDKEYDGDLICDPVMGVGTSCLAAYMMKRRYIGVEMDEKRFNFSKMAAGYYANFYRPLETEHEDFTLNLPVYPKIDVDAEDDKLYLLPMKNDKLSPIEESKPTAKRAPKPKNTCRTCPHKVEDNECEILKQTVPDNHPWCNMHPNYHKNKKKGRTK